MEELTIEEIIRYAIRIEQASVLFYRKASKRLEGNALKSLTDELGDQEMEHLTELKKLLNNEILFSERADYTFNLDTTLIDRLIQANEIPAQATPANVLRIALSWEMNTERAYEKLLGLVDIGDLVMKVFRRFRDMEGMHIRSIKEKMSKPKGSA